MYSSKFRAIFTGFDSAWADNPRAPGAIASIIMEDRVFDFLPPKLVNFDEARAEIDRLSAESDVHLVAIDQPTIVPNEKSARPVERVVGTLISALKGGVQPAFRAKTSMFGDGAPIWRFLASLPHKQAPASAIGATVGKYLIEVYPALMIAGVMPSYRERRKLPKYNPHNRKQFSCEDWNSLLVEMPDLVDEVQIHGLREWCLDAAKIKTPVKGDQDKVDAVLCSIQGYLWWRDGIRSSVIVGDLATGYVIAAADEQAKTYLERAAGLRGVPIQRPWGTRELDESEKEHAERRLRAEKISPTLRVESSNKEPVVDSSESAPAVILVEPQLGENIGTSARAMMNCGLSDLRLVQPRDGWPNDRAVAAASGAEAVLERARVFATTAEAVADLNRVYATTARRRGLVKPVMTPQSAAGEMRAAIGAGQTAGVMFGPERKGLHNDEVLLAAKIIEVPLNAAHTSLNLAQAVLLVGWEWWKAADLTPGEFIPALTGDNPLPPAPARDIVNLFEHLETELDAAGYFFPPHKKQAMVHNLRAMLQRAQFTEQEVRTMRGVVKALSQKRKGR